MGDRFTAKFLWQDMTEDSNISKCVKCSWFKLGTQIFCNAGRFTSNPLPQLAAASLNGFATLVLAPMPPICASLHPSAVHLYISNILPCHPSVNLYILNTLLCWFWLPPICQNRHQLCNTNAFVATRFAAIELSTLPLRNDARSGGGGTSPIRSPRY